MEVSLLFCDILVNKIGDKNVAVFERCQKALIIMINNYPAMSLRIVKKVVEFINRKNQTIVAW